MERTFYNAFYNRTGNIRLSLILSRAAYLVFTLSYRINKMLHLQHKTSGVDIKEAEEKVSAASPRPDIYCSHDRNEKQENLDLSIIVPIYNYEKVLGYCLDSVVNQETHYRYEVFLVDDGSTDGSSAIADAYGAVRNVHILHQANLGISAARNNALSRAAGKYIMFVDCDDYLEKDAVETLMDIACRDNCDIVEGGYYTFDGNADSKRYYIQKPVLLDYNESDKLMTYTGYPWAKVFRRELFDGVGFPVNSWFEDTLVKMILFRRCDRYAYCAKAVYGYRKYEGNYTETQVKSARGLEHIWMLDWMAELSETLAVGTQESLYKALLYHLGALFLYRIESLPEELKECAFLMGGQLLDKYAPNDRPHIRLPYMFRELERAYGKKDFNWWKLVCRYM